MKRVALLSSLALCLCAACAISAYSGESSMASKANISSHAPHGHASSHYLCGELDLKVLYNRDVPAIEFQDNLMPITRVENTDTEQYRSTLGGEDVLLTILDHAVTLKIGDKTYEGCEKIACVPLLPPE